MPESNKKGLVIFGAAIAIIALVCIVAYIITGDQGIEERFTEAVGLSGEAEEEEGGGFLGFNIEGNILSYLVVLILLIVVCAAAYWKFGRKPDRPRK